MQFVKHILAAAVVLGDVVFGVALPAVIKNLHHETRPHLYWATGIYALLAVLTVWVIVSVIQGRRPARTPSPTSTAMAAARRGRR